MSADHTIYRTHLGDLIEVRDHEPRQAAPYAPGATRESEADDGTGAKVNALGGNHSGCDGMAGSEGEGSCVG